jgi:lysophospholipase L1-like esterase
MALPAGQAAVVKTILCYGDSNTWGCIPLTGPQPPRRYGPARRWPGVLRRELGDGYWIVEEGLNGRTTVWDDPLEPFRSGKELLVPCLMTHEPIDLVIVMLGTNDLRSRYLLNPAVNPLRSWRRPMT